MSTFIGNAYEPSDAVKFFHELPRLSVFTGGSVSENEWPAGVENLDLGSLQNGTPTSNYFVGLISLPVIIMVAGCFSIIVMQLCLFLRYCCKCLNCGPPVDAVNEDPEKVIKSRNRVLWFFWLFLAIMFLSMCALYFPREDLNTASNNIVTSLQLLSNTFTSLADQTSIIDDSAGFISEKVNECGKDTTDQSLKSAYTATATAMDGLEEGASGVNALVANLPDILDSVVTSVEVNADAYTNIFLLMFAIAGVVLAVIFTLGAKLGSKALMFSGYFLGVVICLLATIACSILLIILTAYADICMDPPKTMGGSVGGSAEDMMLYFSRCTAEDPFKSNLDLLQKNLDDAQDSIDQIDGYCNNDIGTKYEAIKSSVDVIAKDTSCLYLHEIYDTFFNDAVCTNSFDGLYKIWLIAFVMTFSLFFVLVCSCIMWQYFDVPGAWKMRPRDVHTRTHDHLTGTTASASHPHAQYEPVGGNIVKQEYTFTAASPSAPALTRREIEMI